MQRYYLPVSLCGHSHCCSHRAVDETLGPQHQLWQGTGIQQWSPRVSCRAPRGFCFWVSVGFIWLFDGRKNGQTPKQCERAVIYKESTVACGSSSCSWNSNCFLLEWLPKMLARQTCVLGRRSWKREVGGCQLLESQLMMSQIAKPKSQCLWVCVIVVIWYFDDEQWIVLIF